jgi:hypothetical protein
VPVDVDSAITSVAHETAVTRSTKASFTVFPPIMNVIAFVEVATVLPTFDLSPDTLTQFLRKTQCRAALWIVDIRR